MKRLLILISFASILSSNHNLLAQDMSSNADLLEAYKKRSPLYDYTESRLNNIDSVPDYLTQTEKLKITGTIYQSDGITPAKDVILYIFQPDDKGIYKMERDSNRKRFIQHRAWIKTDADGKYTFYTFMPGKLLRSKELKQIRRIIKEPGKAEYDMTPFFFNDDPLLPELTLACQAEAAMSMLRINEKDGMFTANKDIKLTKNSPTDL